MNAAVLTVVGAAGAILGSFANVMIHRLPREESIVVPGSRCPHCGTAIHPRDNVPLISYVLLRGRCRACGERIPGRYPLVEALMAALALWAWVGFPDLLTRLWAFTLLFLLVVITFIDLDHQLILNRVSYPGIALGLVFALAQGRLLPVVLSAAGAAALLAAIVIVSRGGMGGGDVKLAGMIGAFLGWPGVVVGLFGGFFIGGGVGLLLLALRLRGRKEAIPFGPALAAGAVIGLFWGEAIWRWYWPLP